MRRVVVGLVLVGGVVLASSCDLNAPKGPDKLASCFCTCNGCIDPGPNGGCNRRCDPLNTTGIGNQCWARTATSERCFPAGTDDNEIVRRCQQACKSEASPAGTCLMLATVEINNLIDAGVFAGLHPGDNFQRTRGSIREQACTVGAGTVAQFLTSEMDAQTVHLDGASTITGWSNGNPHSTGLNGSLGLRVDQCDVGGCNLTMASLHGSAAGSVTTGSVSVSVGAVDSIGVVTGRVAPDGQITLNTDTVHFSLRGRASSDGDSDYTSGSYKHAHDFQSSGFYDFATGGIQLYIPIDPHEKDLAEIDLYLAGQSFERPPSVQITGDATTECDLETGTGLVQASAFASPGDSPIDTYSWWSDGSPAGGGETLTEYLAPGEHVITVSVVDEEGKHATDSVTLTVVDTSPPGLDAVPLSLSTCETVEDTVTLVPPTVSDCSPVTIEGEVIAKNGVTLPQPEPLGPGYTVSAGTGTFTVRWTATDEGDQSSTLDQVFQVGPALWAHGSLDMRDRATAVSPSGGWAGLANSGTGLTTLGVESETGGIWSQADVFLRDRAKVNGDVQSAGQFTTQNQTIVTGNISEGVAVSLPRPPELVVSFTGGTSYDLQPDQALTLAPGSYGNVVIKSRSTLNLSSGKYFLNAFDIEPQGKVVLDKADGGIEIYVRDSMIHRGEFIHSDGAVNGFLLGYAGSQDLFLEAPLDGQVIAPNATLLMGPLPSVPGSSPTFQGEFFARNLEVRPDVRVECRVIEGND